MFNNSNSGKFFFSILTAIIVGVGSAFIGIEGFEKVIAYSRIANTSDSNISDEEDMEDPTFIKNFSRAFIYSALETEIIDELENIFIDIKDEISALAYSVIDMEKNNVILEKDSERLLPIASVTKLATAVVAKQVLSGDKQVEITKNILNTEGNTARFRLGEKFKVNELFYPLLMVSSNDAAEALAQAYNRKEFIKKMNDWANSIGAYRTYFHDPSGLSKENVSTAKDIAIIAKWIKEKYPEILDITLTKSKTIRTHTWTNPTHFLNLSVYEGGKNGYTPEAKLTSVSIFSIGEPKKLYSVVLLGSKQRDEDMLTVLNKALK